MLLMLSAAIAAVIVVTAIVAAMAGTPGRSEAPALRRSIGASLVGSTSCSVHSLRVLTGLLFDWDTSVASRPAVVQRIVGSADPTGLETPGLLLDLGAYLPSDDAWQQLARYRTVQRASVVAITVPSTWRRTAAARLHQLGSGTAAFTIDLLRHREGTVAAIPVTATSGTTFTMFVRCSPGVRGYRLLRLSVPGQPLP